MAYPMRVGLSNHCPFTLTSSPRSGLILCDHTRYGASVSFRISVQVKTQARKEDIVKISPEEYQVSVHACARGRKSQPRGYRTAGEIFFRAQIIRESSSRSIFPKKVGRDRLIYGEFALRGKSAYWKR
jgi:hypothetical protein